MGIDASRVMVVHGCTWMLLTEPHDGHIVVGLQLADSLFLLHPEDLDRMGEGFQAIAGDLARMRAGLPLDQDDA